MAVYRNSAELTGKQLALGDHVIFDVKPGMALFGFQIRTEVSRLYKVDQKSGFYLLAYGQNNDIIWADLGIGKNRHDIAYQLVGKPMNPESRWPCSDLSTLADATAIVLALYRHMEGIEDITRCIQEAVAKRKAAVEEIKAKYPESADVAQVLADADFGCHRAGVIALTAAILKIPADDMHQLVEAAR